MAKRNPPNASRETPNPDMNPFLKATDIVDGDVLKLSGWVQEKQGAYGPQIVMEVKHVRLDKDFDFGIGVGSLNHRRMFKLFGPDFRRWQGQIVVKVGQTRSGNKFVDIVQDAVPF